MTRSELQSRLRAAERDLEVAQEIGEPHAVDRAERALNDLRRQLDLTAEEDVSR
jgi:hypothetical protein